MRRCGSVFFAVTLAFCVFPLFGTGQMNTNFTPDYKLYEQVLARYVTDAGVVDYKGLRDDKDFELVIQSISLFHPNNSWKREEQMCFWINVYNMFTLKLICDNYGIQSMNDLGNPWDQSFIPLGKKQVYSLNRIEKEILMIRFRDPRIHFALCNGTASAPKLSIKPFRPEEMDKQLSQSTKAFINDKKLNQVGADQVQLSQLFKLYLADFSVAKPFSDWFNMYSLVQITASTTIEYMDFNWGLNGK